ncbi:MAG: FERM domain-containing protein [Shouchella clausii]
MSNEPSRESARKKAGEGASSKQASGDHHREYPTNRHSTSIRLNDNKALTSNEAVAKLEALCTLLRDTEGYYVLDIKVTETEVVG